MQLLAALERHEEFQLWRDLVCLPELERIRAELRDKQDELPEVILRANLKTEYKLDQLFYKVFSLARSDLEVNKPESTS